MPGLDALPVAALLCVGLAIACAGLVHGTLGLGFPLVATPLIALVTGIKSAVVLVVAPTLVVVIVAIVAGGSFVQTIRDWWRMPFWVAAGALTGTQLFIVFDPAPLTLLLAVVILVYLALDSMGRGRSALVARHPHAFGMLFGFLGGVFDGAVNIAAPPLLIYFLSIGLAPGALVKALNLCFLTGKTTQFATLASTAGVPVWTWVSTLPLCVVGAGTSLVGARLRDRMPAATYRRWLKQALFAMAALLVFQFVMLMRSAA